MSRPRKGPTLATAIITVAVLIVVALGGLFAFNKSRAAAEVESLKAEMESVAFFYPERSKKEPLSQWVGEMMDMESDRSISGFDLDGNFCLLGHIDDNEDSQWFYDSRTGTITEHSLEEFTPCDAMFEEKRRKAMEQNAFEQAQG